MGYHLSANSCYRNQYDHKFYKNFDGSAKATLLKGNFADLFCFIDGVKIIYFTLHFAKEIFQLNCGYSLIPISQECKADEAVVASLKSNETTWVDEVQTLTICTNPSNDYRRSFPSGHASQVCKMIAKFRKNYSENLKSISVAPY